MQINSIQQEDPITPGVIPEIDLKDENLTSMQLGDSKTSSSTFLSNTLFKTALAIVLLTVGAWGKWVTTTITDITSDAARNSERLARIEQLLLDHFRSDDALGRNNPRTVSR